MRPLICRLLILGLLLAAACSDPAWPQSGAARKEAASYYKKWLEEDVYWIISEEERDVFAKLANDEEREAFIEQFWNRRNPDPSSGDN